MIFLNEKYFKIISLFILIGFLTFVSCEEDKSLEPEPEGELILIHPNGGEQLTGGDQYTIQISNTDLYDSLSFFFSLNNGASWQPMHMIENSDGLYIWQLPWANSTNVKIRILAYAQGKIYIFISEYVFEITGSSSRIIEPASSSVFTNHKTITIKWNTSLPFDRYELYYSKYSDEVIYYGNPDNKIVYSSDWILLDENIDGNLGEYNWENPYLYSNKVQIKLVGFLENEQYEILSDVFTVKLDDILFEERQYLEKLSVGNRWIFKMSFDNSFFDSTYYLVRDVVGEFLNEDIKYYEIEEKEVTNTISYSLINVKDRDYFTPDIIMQDGDVFIRENYSGENGNWGIHHYHSESLKDLSEEVFSENLFVKETYIYDSGSGISSETTKRAKDIGMYYKKSGGEGYYIITTLKGALIDGVVYGDTTFVK